MKYVLLYLGLSYVDDGEKSKMQKNVSQLFSYRILPSMNLLVLLRFIFLNK
jgi:hypothetical protein